MIPRETLGRMRFHHQLDTDDDAPVRRSTPGTRTLAVDDDGFDLAAALKTIQVDGEHAAPTECLAVVLEGHRLDILEEPTTGRHEVQLSAGDLLRPMRAAELSDGQLRFLFLAAALLAVRPADVVVLNEPESSLHADLLVGLSPPIRESLPTSSTAKVPNSSNSNSRPVRRCSGNPARRPGSRWRAARSGRHADMGLLLTLYWRTPWGSTLV